MGELDGKPFVKAAKTKYAGEDEIAKAMEHCSLWEDYLRDPSWHPYKVIMVGGSPKVCFSIGKSNNASLINAFSMLH